MSMIVAWPRDHEMTSTFGAGELLYTSSRLSTEIPEIVIFGALVFTLQLGSRFPIKDNSNKNLLPGSVTTNLAYLFTKSQTDGYNKRHYLAPEVPFPC